MRIINLCLVLMLGILDQRWNGTQKTMDTSDLKMLGFHEKICFLDMLTCHEKEILKLKVTQRFSIQ